MIQRKPKLKPEPPQYQKLLAVILYVPGKIINFIRHLFDELVLLSVALFLFFVATNTQSGWLFFVVAFALGLLLLSFLNSLLNLRRITVQRLVPEVLYEDETARITLRVFNNSSIPKFFLLLEDPFPALFPDRKNPKVYIPYISPGGHRDVSYERQAYKRGVFSFQPIKILTAGALGFFSLTKKVTAEGNRLTVLPRSFKSTPFSLNGTAPRSARGEKRYRFTGLSFDFAGIREYQPGNETRHIHWPSTARHDSLMVKEFNDVTTHAIALAIDTHETAEFGYDRNTTTEHMVRTAATILKNARTGSYHVDYVTLNGTAVAVERNISPYKMQMRLAEVNAVSPNPLDALMQEIVRETRLQSHLFILKVLPFADLEWITGLASKRINVTVVFFEPLAFLSDQDPEFDEVKKLSYDEQVKDLIQRGVRVYRYHPCGCVFRTCGGEKS